MYLVIYKQQKISIVDFTGFNIEKFDSLDKAKEFAKKLFMEGKRDIRIAQDLPVEFKVKVEI